MCINKVLSFLYFIQIFIVDITVDIYTDIIIDINADIKKMRNCNVDNNYIYNALRFALLFRQQCLSECETNVDNSLPFYVSCKFYREISRNYNAKNKKQYALIIVSRSTFQCAPHP